MFWPQLYFFGDGCKRCHLRKEVVTLLFIFFFLRAYFGSHLNSKQKYYKNPPVKIKLITLIVPKEPVRQSVILAFLISSSTNSRMNDRKRRLKSIQIDLEEMYSDLFGTQYVPGLQEIDKSEFNSIIETFRERLFTIRELQQQREKKETKK